ncbi:hypothetical protein E2320_007383 [Naja naja]|nr:hypothetical protein E2320_007383 [Naja naja]
MMFQAAPILVHLPHPDPAEALPLCTAGWDLHTTNIPRAPHLSGPNEIPIPGGDTGAPLTLQRAGQNNMQEGGGVEKGLPNGHIRCGQGPPPAGLAPGQWLSAALQGTDFPLRQRRPRAALWTLKPRHALACWRAGPPRSPVRSKGNTTKGCGGRSCLRSAAAPAPAAAPETLPPPPAHTQSPYLACSSVDNPSPAGTASPSYHHVFCAELA